MILVVGATGYLGGMITRRLLEQGHNVRVLVRPTSDYQPLVQAGAHPSTGDLKNPSSLSTACEGVEIVITTANSAQRGGDDNPQTVDLEGNRSLIDAAHQTGVQQFIFISGAGSDVNSPVPFMQAKAKTEQYLQASGLNYTIFVPNLFMDVWIPMIIGTALQQQQPVRIIGEGQRQHSFIAVHDVAAFAVAAIRHQAAVNQHIPLGGPEAISWRDIIATTERVLNRSIPLQTLAIGDMLPGFPELITGLMTSLEMQNTIMPMEETAQRFNVQQTTVEQFVRQAFATYATTS